MQNGLEFTIYPAIDLFGGACVRLFKGDYAAKTEYSQEPEKVAERWLSQGASWLHVVDLDGAKSGQSVNEGTIRKIVEVAREFRASVQVGGGIRTYEAISRFLEAGVTRCVIGTAALDMEWMAGAVERFGQEGLVAGLDGRGGKLAVNGWLDQTDVKLVEIAQQLSRLGVRHALVTDVEKDGTLSGANLALAREIQTESGIHAIASGGIRNLDDVMAAEQAGLWGVIAGRSLYDGTLDLAEAIAAVKAVKKC